MVEDMEVVGDGFAVECVSHGKFQLVIGKDRESGRRYELSDVLSRPEVNRVVTMPEDEFKAWYAQRKEVVERERALYSPLAEIPDFTNPTIPGVLVGRHGAVHAVLYGLDNAHRCLRILTTLRRYV
jgi:hypothetical protein